MFEEWVEEREKKDREKESDEKTHVIVVDI